jgi:hypothetical protein
MYSMKRPLPKKIGKKDPRERGFEGRSYIRMNLYICPSNLLQSEI